MDLLELGGGDIERVYVAEERLGLLPGGCFVASMSDLLLLRAETVVWRGEDGDMVDLEWLLAEVAKQGCCFPELALEEIDVLVRAVETCLGGWARFVVAAIIGERNCAAAMKLLY